MCWVIIWLQNITVVTIKVVMYATGDCIRFVSRFLFRNKWLHYWLVEIFSSLLCSASQLFFDSLSSDNTACLRRSASKMHGKRRDNQGGAKKDWGSGRVG